MSGIYVRTFTPLLGRHRTTPLRCSPHRSFQGANTHQGDSARTRTLTLIDVSRGNGQSRTVEMNQRVLANLDRMIGEIETDQHKDTPDAS